MIELFSAVSPAIMLLDRMAEHPLVSPPLETAPRMSERRENRC